MRAALGQAHTLSGQVQMAQAVRYAGPRYVAHHAIGNALRTSRTLVQGGFETRLFYTGYGGFDTHGDQGAGTGLQPTLFQRLDDAVAAFSAGHEELRPVGQCVVAVFTEFGRRNYENGQGTDHGGAFTRSSSAAG